MKNLALCCLIAMLFFITACGGGSKPIVVTLSPSAAQAIDIGQSVSLTAAVANDSKNGGVSWALTGPGSLTGQTTTAATYVAPTSAPGGSAKITATSVTTATISASVTITVTAVPSISTTTLPAGVEGTAYSQTLSVAGGAGTLAYSLSTGTLPAGLSLSSTTGAITGTPTGPNTPSSFTVKVTDTSNAGPQSATQALSIAVNLPPAPAITTATLSGGTEFTAYSQTLAATGYAPLTYSVSAGTLPAGLALNAGTGAITGTPTGPAGPIGFTVQVTDHSSPAQTGTQALSIAVSLPPAPSITTTSLPNGTASTPYSQTLAVTGGHAPFTWSLASGSSLPSALGLNTSGAITGTLSGATGSFPFTVQVVDASNPPQTATQALSITATLGPLAVTATTLPGGALTETYPSTSLAATGGIPPYTWSITTGAVPGGLNFNTSSGAITGTPTASGTFPFTAQVKDSTNTTATGNFSITVNAALAVSTGSTLTAGTQGTSYSTNLAATGGVTPYTWTVVSPGTGSLPAGLQLSSGGQLSGIPTVSGTFPFTVQVADTEGGTATANLSLTLGAAAALAVTTSGSLPGGTAGAVYPTTTLAATGGIQPYTWSITSAAGTFPPGLNLDTTNGSTSGQITGTPSTPGTYNFTVQVTDSAANTASASLSITVVAASTCDKTLTGKESLLLGDYAFVLRGFDSTGNPATVGGVFVASGTSGAGNITAGTLDLNLFGGVQSNLSFTSATYNLGQDTTGGNRGCMTIVTSAGTQNYAFVADGVTAGVASNGHMINFDTTGPFTAGIIRKATSSAFSTSAITGNWAFGFSGEKAAGTSGGKFAAVGVFAFSNGAGTGVADSNENGVLDNNSLLTAFPATAGVTLSSVAYSIGSNGRGTLSFVPGGNTTVNVIAYVVSTSEMLIMSGDPLTGSSSSPAYTGSALKQSGTFSNSSLNGTSVLYMSGLSSTAGGSHVQFGLVTGNGTSATFTFKGYDNDGGTISSPTSDPHNSVSGGFSVASNGRVTLTATGANNLPVFYLSSAGTAFFLNAGGGVSSGFFEPQSGGPFSSASASGTYGIGVINPEVSTVSDDSGDVTFTSGSTAISGTDDNNAQGVLSPGGAISDTYSIDASGVGLSPNGCTLTGPSANCKGLFVVISPNKAVQVDVKSTETNPRITVIEK
ncbi:MAG: putative Ig domain-containing protein [Candidatus Acidiferrum sp.]